MDNATKRYLASLEARVLKLENILGAMTYSMDSAAMSSYSCGQCGAHDPANSGHVCGMSDCCQGLNPTDDESV